MAVVPDLDRRFDYHPPTDPAVREAHEKARAIAKETCELLAELCPESAGREAALMATHMEEAMFWTNAAIARHSPR